MTPRSRPISKAGEPEVTEPPTSHADEIERGQGSPGKVPLTARLMLHDSLTARRAAGIIALVTVVITAGGGILEWLADHQEYPTLGKGMWLAVDGKIKSPEELREYFAAKGVDLSQLCTTTCGSGVTAAVAQQDAERVAKATERGYPAFMSSLHIDAIVNGLQAETE